MNEYLLEIVFYIKCFIDRRLFDDWTCGGLYKSTRKKSSFLLSKGCQKCIYDIIYINLPHVYVNNYIYFDFLYGILRLNHSSQLGKIFFLISYKKNQFIFCTAKKTLNSQQMRLSKYQYFFFNLFHLQSTMHIDIVDNNYFN